jgi:NADH-quinone oxidoreductase subunit L
LNNWIGNWLAPSVGGTYGNVTGLLHFTLLGIITLVLVAIGVAIAIWVFGLGRIIPEVAPASRSPFTLAGRNDVYGDAINETVFMRPGEGLVAGVAKTDTGVDETGVGISQIIAGVGARLRRWQTGFVRSYALTMVAGAFAVGVIFVLGRLG